MAYVYIYFDPRKNPIEPIYVGKGNKERVRDHLYDAHNIFLNRKIKGIRKAGLEPIIQLYVDDIDDNEALTIEENLISKYGKAHDKTGTLCNFIDGGKGGRKGFKHTEETKKLFSIQRKGKKQTEAQYKANCSRGISEETRKKISQANKGIFRGNREAIINYNKTRIISDYTRQLWSKQRKGVKQTKEHINKVKESRQRNGKFKKVKCINNEIIYKSIKEAANLLNLKETAIASVANGSRNHHKNYKFCYVD